MEGRLSLEFLRVVENAAIAAARTMGFGDRHRADEVAVEAMRKTMDQVEMDGTIVIGEGERDEAPMLYIGEKVGLSTHAPKALFPQVDIAVDPLEGTNLCATGAPNAIAVLAASEKGGLLHAPDLYMEKIVVGPQCKGAVELDAAGRGVAVRLHRADHHQQAVEAKPDVHRPAADGESDNPEDAYRRERLPHAQPHAHREDRHQRDAQHFGPLEGVIMVVLIVIIVMVMVMVMLSIHNRVPHYFK